LINIDTAHILRLMEMGGGTYMAMGKGSGANKTMQALNKAINHPLLDTVPLEQARGVIVNFHSSASLPFEELTDALNLIKRSTGKECEIITGIVLDENMGDEIEITLIVTGIGCTSVSDPDIAYLHHFGQPQVTALPEQMIPAASMPAEPTNEFLAVPSYLRNRQIPLELIEEEYGKAHLRPDLQPDP